MLGDLARGSGNTSQDRLSSEGSQRRRPLVLVSARAAPPEVCDWQWPFSGDPWCGLSRTRGSDFGSCRSHSITVVPGRGPWERARGVKSCSSWCLRQGRAPPPLPRALRACPVEEPRLGPRRRRAQQ